MESGFPRISHISAYAAHQGGLVLWHGLGRPGITSKIGNCSAFVLFGWRFVFIRANHEMGRTRALLFLMPSRLWEITKLLLSYLWASRKWVAPRTYLIGRSARGYSVSPPINKSPHAPHLLIISHLTLLHTPEYWYTRSIYVVRVYGKIPSQESPKGRDRFDDFYLYIIIPFAIWQLCFSIAAFVAIMHAIFITSFIGYKLVVLLWMNVFYRTFYLFTWHIL